MVYDVSTYETEWRCVFDGWRVYLLRFIDTKIDETPKT